MGTLMDAHRKVALFACGVMLLITSTAAGAQCTAETEVGRRLVVTYATHNTDARPAGVPVVSADRVRVLTDPADSGVCSRLFGVFWAQWQNPDEPKPGWHWTYYQVGDHYYVVAHRTTPPVTQNVDGTLSISLNWSPIFVVDGSYRVVASIAR